MKTAMIAGATGLVGSHLLTLLLSGDRYEKVIAITRKPLPVHPKLEQLTFNMADSASYRAGRADDVYCCLGTTIAVAGSKENFRKVDFVYPSVMATEMLSSGARQYLLVSALGADKSSSIFYNRVKGEVEDEITRTGYRAVHIFRPSLLLGNRTEKRTGEDAAKIFYKLFGFLIPKKYKGIEAAKVANAMYYCANLEQSGVHIHESGEIQSY
ncbi:MAG TPA: NAD-dependent epimerase/dehydratase family protein [Chryseolinea sp.]|nr:NAD-dependent epimerase/dehydratase family protein [Chryseolinea sp.]